MNSPVQGMPPPVVVEPKKSGYFKTGLKVAAGVAVVSGGFVRDLQDSKPVKFDDLKQPKNVTREQYIADKTPLELSAQTHYNKSSKVQSRSPDDRRTILSNAADSVAILNNIVYGDLKDTSSVQMRPLRVLGGGVRWLGGGAEDLAKVPYYQMVLNAYKPWWDLRGWTSFDTSRAERTIVPGDPKEKQYKANKIEMETLMGLPPLYLSKALGTKLEAASTAERYERTVKFIGVIDGLLRQENVTGSDYKPRALAASLVASTLLSDASFKLEAFDPSDPQSVQEKKKEQLNEKVRGVIDLLKNKLGDGTFDPEETLKTEYSKLSEKLGLSTKATAGQTISAKETFEKSLSDLVGPYTPDKLGWGDVVGGLALAGAGFLVGRWGWRKVEPLVNFSADVARSLRLPNPAKIDAFMSKNWPVIRERCNEEFVVSGVVPSGAKLEKTIAATVAALTYLDRKPGENVNGPITRALERVEGRGPHRLPDFDVVQLYSRATSGYSIAQALGESAERKFLRRHTPQDRFAAVFDACFEYILRSESEGPTALPQRRRTARAESEPEPQSSRTTGAESESGGPGAPPHRRRTVRAEVVYPPPLQLNGRPETPKLEGGHKTFLLEDKPDGGSPS